MINGAAATPGAGGFGGVGGFGASPLTSQPSGGFGQQTSAFGQGGAAKPTNAFTQMRR